MTDETTKSNGLSFKVHRGEMDLAYLIKYDIVHHHNCPINRETQQYSCRPDSALRAYYI